MSRLLSLAARNVRRNARRSVLTLAAIVLGVAALVSLRGFVEGFLRMSVRDVVETRTGALQVHRAGWADSVEASPTELSIPDADELIDRIERLPGVRGVTGRIQFGGLVGNGRSQTMFAGRGIDPARETKACPQASSEVETGGSPLATGDGAVALVGSELARSLDAVTVPSREGEVAMLDLSSSSPGGRANALSVRVKGLTRSGLPFENKRVVTVPLALAQELLGLEGQVTELAVGVHELERVEEVAAAVRVELGSAYEVHTWPELQPFLRDVLGRQRIIFGMISAILLVIVLSGIASTMLMSVFDRVREIGTMLAVGMRRRQILALFLLEAGLLGLSGGLVGAVLGRAIVAALAVNGIPMKVIGNGSILYPTVSPAFLALAVLLALIGSLVAAVVPARRAAGLDPVEALRSL